MIPNLFATDWTGKAPALGRVVVLETCCSSREAQSGMSLKGFNLSWSSTSAAVSGLEACMIVIGR